MQRSFSICVLTLVPLALGGCSGSTSASGTVTYENQPVAKGYINFIPADGKGPTVGAPIRDGNYEAKNLLPGRKRVQIIGVEPVDFATSSAEMARQAQARGEDLRTLDLVDKADIVPEDATGNNEVHELKSGHQTLDFALSAPTP